MFSCTDESEIENTTKYNNKSTENEYEEFIPRTYHQYEENNYTDDSMISIISNFSELINNNKINIETYDINTAVFSMETFFNAAIVDKQTEFETTSYNIQKFSCTIDLDENGKIDAEVLRNKYISFLNTVISSMGNKFLQFSDVYVDNITSNSVTIVLETPPFVDNGNFIPRRDKIVRTINEQYTTPINDVDDWNNYYADVDEVVRSYSKKIIDNICFLNIHSFFAPFPPNSTVGAFAYTPWFDDGETMSLITGIGLRDEVNMCIVHANAYTNNINQAYPPYSNAPRTNIDVIPLCEIRWNQNKQYMKLIYINELKYAFVATVRLRDFLHEAVMFNRDVFEGF